MMTTALLDPLIVPQSEVKPVLDVLILDDHEPDRRLLRRLCRKAGLECEVQEAADLQDFRARLDDRAFDLVFLDYHLAIDTGLDALKLLRGHAEQVEAIPIMITSVERHDVAVEAMRAGCADYLTKEELSVEAIRKSIVSAFERRILVTVLNESRSAQRAMQATIRRMALTCGPEIRSVLSGTLRQLRALRRKDGTDAQLRHSLTGLEKSCNDIFGFLDDVEHLLRDGAPVPAAVVTPVEGR